MEDDPVLTYISTHLGALKRQATQRHRSAGSLGAGGGAGTGSGSSAPTTSPGSATSALPPEVQQWEVAYSDIHFKTVIGRGSFGRVYLAQWRQTPVAVKILLSAGVSSHG